MRFARSSRYARIRTTLALGVAGFLGIVGVYQGVIAAPDVNIDADSDGADISQSDTQGLRGLIAEDSEAPSVQIQVAPEGLVSPGRDVTIVTIPENFGDADEIHTTWCIDGAPVTHWGAGGVDELVEKNGERFLENPYGRIRIPEGGYAICESEFLNEQGGFFTEGFAGGQVGNEDTKTIPARPNLNNFEKEPYLPFDIDNWAYVQRLPNIDEDQDGLDDEWEVRYFGGRIIPNINENEDLPLAEKVYPVLREDILRAVRPQDDPDQDGWEWSYNYDEMRLVARTELRPFDGEGAAPPNYALDSANYDIFYALNPFSFAWQLGVPYVSIPEDRRVGGTSGFGEAEVIGFGEWDGSNEATGCTNLEEYTFGTDPLAADTDDDQVLDCRDIAGEGQSSLTFPVQKKVGQSYEIDMHAFTLNSQWRLGQLDSFELPQDGLVAGGSPSRYRDLHARKYVRLDYEHTLPISQGQGFEVHLQQEPEVVTTKTTGRLGEERIRVEAVPVLNEADDSTLEFNWFLNGTFQEDASGTGKRFFFFNVDDPRADDSVVGACQEHAVTVNVVDPSTDNSASEQLRIDVRPPIEFTKEVVGHVNRSRLGVDAQDYSGEGDETVDLARGARTGDVVRFRANVLGVAPTVAAAASGDADQQTCAEEGITLDQLTYKWSFDGRVDQEQTGRGGENTEAEFEILDEPTGTANDINASFEQTAASGHIVTLEVFGPDGELLTAADERITAVAPSIDVNVQAETLEVNSKAAEEVLGLAQEVDYLIEEGDTVTVSALAEFFPPGAAISFEVSRNDDFTPEGSIAEDGQSITFDVGEPGDIEIVRFSAVSESGERAQGEVQLRVVTEEELRSVLERRSLIGALSEFLPGSVRSVFAIALGAGLFAAVLLVVLMFTGSTRPAASGSANVGRRAAQSGKGDNTPSA